jgi:hypothetical protein
MSNNALISQNEPAYSYNGTLLGERIADTSQTPFEVAPPLFWVACADDVVADQYYYDPTTQQCSAKPAPPPPPPKGTGPGVI